MLRLSLILIAIATLSFFLLDQEAARFFAKHDFTFLKPITALGNAAWIVALSLLAWLYFKKRDETKAKKALFVFLSVALSGLIVDILKPIIGRARPKLLMHENFFGFEPLTFKASFWSMPSGHSATAFALGVSLALLYPRYRFFFIALATLVAFSRIALIKHYPSDVIIGSLIGAISAIWLYDKIKP